MTPERLPDGRILVPRRAEAPDGTIGEGTDTLGPTDPGFAVWDDYLKAREE